MAHQLRASARSMVFSPVLRTRLEFVDRLRRRASLTVVAAFAAVALAGAIGHAAAATAAAATTATATATAGATAGATATAGVTASAAATTAATATAADAQTVPTSQDQGSQNQLSEVVVTGSRIRRQADERLEPTTVIDSDYMNERAYTNVIQALNELPQFGQPDNSLVGTQSAFGVGQSFANLFSLGSQRTLTLVDGLRFVPSNSPSIFGATGEGGEQVDLNVIPTELIDRIETIAVGGAPIYGSDAIAGTINIILKHDYEGFDVDAQGGDSTHGDADSWRVRALAGKNFFDQRANVTFDVEYAHQDELLNQQRQQFADGIAYVVPPTTSPYGYELINNERIGSLSEAGVPMVADGYLNFTPNFAITNSSGQILSFNNAGQLVPWNLGPADGSGVFNIGGDGVNLPILGTILSPQSRLNMTGLGNFKINDHVSVFAQLWYSGTYTTYPVTQGAYDTLLFAPAGQPSGNLILNVNDPFLSASEQATIAQNLAAFAAVPGNPTQTSQFYLARLNEDIQDGGASADQITRRGVLGVNGSFPLFGNDFDYQVTANYGRSVNSSISPSIDFQDFQNALDAIVGPGGNIICAPGYKNAPVPTQTNTCSPFDPFGYGVASPAAFAYVTDLAKATSTLTQRDFVASLNGNLFQLPGGPVGIALGYENRRESADFQPDQFYQQALGYEIPIAPLEGQFHTNEFYGETLIPLFSAEENIPALHSLQAEAAVREVDHSIAGKADTWTAGLRWEPVSILQFRGNFTRSIRSPDVTEAFLPTSEAFDTASDPCDKSLVNSGPDPAVRAHNCAAAGIVQPFTSNILSFTEPITVSGDPNLQNEVADSRTYGFVLRPLERMSLTVDYVKIDISQAIVSLDPTNVLDECYDDPVFPNSYCNDVTRSSNGQITLVKTGYANAGYENFNGITDEFDYSWALPADLGSMDLRVNHFFGNRLNLQVGVADVEKFAGSIGNSKQRAVLNLGWTKGPFSALWQTTFTGPAVWDNSLSPTNTQLQGVGAWWVHNLTLDYDATQHLRVQFVVDNVFDKQAPFPLPAYPPNSTITTITNPNGIETYFSGILGRYFVLSAEYKF
jgi:iron complex outermembrane recepter protein